MQSNAKVASEADVTFPISFVLELKVVRAVPCPKELLEERGADALTAVQEMAVCVDEACSDRLLLRILGANGTPGVNNEHTTSVAITGWLRAATMLLATF